MNKIQIIDLKDEDFVNYKKPSMYIGFPYCTFKCGKDVCQNAQWEKANIISIDPMKIVDRYMKNDLTSAIVMGGLEPLDSYKDLQKLISCFRLYTKDDIVIYTGYDKDEVFQMARRIGYSLNIIMKFGRYVPGQEPHYDDVLGVKLASDNQYAQYVKYNME